MKKALRKKKDSHWKPDPRGYYYTICDECSNVVILDRLPTSHELCIVCAQRHLEQKMMLGISYIQLSRKRFMVLGDDAAKFDRLVEEMKNILPDHFVSPADIIDKFLRDGENWGWWNE